MTFRGVRVPRDLLLMSLALFTWGVGEGMFLIFQPLYLQELGADPVKIGVILGTLGVAMMVAQVPAGLLADKVGSRPVMWSSWLLGCAAAWIMAFAGSLPLFVLGMLIYGLTSYVTGPMNQYISSVRGSWSVERSLATIGAIYNLGAVIGPGIGGFIAARAGIHSIYVFSSVIFMVSTALVLMVRRPPKEEISELHMQQPNLMRNPRFIGLLALIVMTMFVLYLPQPLTPNYLQNEQGLSLQTIGQLGAVGSLGNALIMLGLGHLSAPAGFLVGQALVGVFALLMWRGDSLLPFFLGFFVLGGYRLSRSMALAFARTFVRADEVGFAFGLVETGNAAAVILAPLMAGLLYQENPEWVYIASAIGIGIMLLANIIFLPKNNVKIPTNMPADTPEERYAA